MTTAYVLGANVLARGMAGPPDTCPILTGVELYDSSAPDPQGQPQLLDSRERRRTTATVRLALAVAERCVDAAGVDTRDLPTVFASAFGDGPLLGGLLETLAGLDAKISPTKFHNSVHNAALGYWSIGAQCRLGGTSIAAGEQTAGVALLRGIIQSAIEERTVLVVIYDAPFDLPLSAVRPVAGPFAATFLLAKSPKGALFRLDAAVLDTCTRATLPTNASLNELYDTNPAARCVPLLESFARRTATVVALPLNDDSALHLTVTPL